MSEALKGLEPQLVWKYFGEISKIPRGSGNEKQIAAYVIGVAKGLGLEAKQDTFGNVVIQKPASAGRERSPMVCLQGHLDMVNEKNKDKVHDFLKDPIEIVRKGNVLMANGTTLGADNGIAVAAGLAIMADKSLEHGPLEFLFTVDEETGLTGAKNLEPGFVKSKTLLNLDSEEEGSLYVGCSGGRDTVGRWKVAFDNAPAKHAPLLIAVRGLKGGHSGLEIDKGRGNSIKIINRVLMALDGLGGRIASIEGGNKRNAIPRECESVVYVPTSKVSKALSTVAELNDVLRAEISTVDPELRVSAEEMKPKKKVKVLKKNLQAQLLRTLAGLPHGVMKMSADIPGLVETSTNLAIITTSATKIEVITTQRSSVNSEIEEMKYTVGAIMELGGAKVKYSAGYPGWKPNLNSTILKSAKSTYQSMFGKEPAIKAIHAGLECGIIGEKYPGMDMVSFGPTLADVHSPDEKLYFDTVGKFWKFLLGILKSVR
ncbi:MAG: aminoacyl-histidine dipeptidase [Ignavibacteria bacterium]|nr:aminoacyl-histidine dipeptidase [Ignavibacteria bacterium]